MVDAATRRLVYALDALGDEDMLIEDMRAAANEYCCNPAEVERAKQDIERAQELVTALREWRETLRRNGMMT